VDLRRISILELVDQYRLVEQAEALKLEVAADYLVMAAWLAYLKSSLLLPKEEQEHPARRAGAAPAIAPATSGRDARGGGATLGA
jgi:chromatin segregation and condensation protein Rec8/ScpA/Scc1 (kleisin family)